MESLLAKLLLLLIFSFTVSCMPTEAGQRGVKTDNGDIEKAYDYVIIGGGTSALVVANRLVEDEKSKRSAIGL